MRLANGIIWSSRLLHVGIYANGRRIGWYNARYAHLPFGLAAMRRHVFYVLRCAGWDDYEAGLFSRSPIKGLPLSIQAAHLISGRST